MGKNVSRINPNKVGNRVIGDVTSALEKDLTMVFSFQYLDCVTEEFCINESVPSSYFVKLYERLKELSRMTMKEFTSTKTKALRNHPIDFSDSKVLKNCFGIPNEDQIVGDSAWQFSISKDEHGRVAGFIIGQVFYIVWLDRNHSLYS